MSICHTKRKNRFTTAVYRVSISIKAGTCASGDRNGVHWRGLHFVQGTIFFALRYAVSQPSLGVSSLDLGRTKVRPFFLRRPRAGAPSLILRRRALARRAPP